MREIRTFELEHDEPAQCWRLAQPLQLHVTEGEVWLTVAGDAGDYWLRAGESLTLPGGVRAWVSAGRTGARFVLALGGVSAPGRAVGQRPTTAGMPVRFANWALRRPWGSRTA